MLTDTRRTPLLTAGLTAVLLVVLAACGGGDKDVPPRGPIEEYVALGDSYASGPGIDPVVDGGCNRSGGNYASLIAEDLGLERLDDMTCGGANTGDLIRAQENKDGVTLNQPQLSPVTAKTDLVTLGIGLNDSGISGEVLYLCLPQMNLRAECERFLREPASAVIRDVGTITDRVKMAIEAIRELSPSTRIVLIGYPKALADDSDCPEKLPLTGEAADRLRLTLKTIDVEYRRLAKDEKIEYVSMYDASDGHDLCSAEPWVNGFTDPPAGQGARLHPTPAFMRAAADEVEKIYGK